MVAQKEGIRLQEINELHEIADQPMEMGDAFLDSLVNTGLGKSDGAWKSVIVPTELGMAFVNAGKL